LFDSITGKNCSVSVSPPGDNRNFNQRFQEYGKGLIGFDTVPRRDAVSKDNNAAAFSPIKVSDGREVGSTANQKNKKKEP